MGRKRQSSALKVYIGSTQVGQYYRAANGATSFKYLDNWLTNESNFPISMSMPLSDRNYTGLEASYFFDGLLPDEPQIRNRIAARENAESGSTFDLLSVIGRDCVGALRFIPVGDDPGDPANMHYQNVTNQGIAERIAALDAAPLGVNASDDYRISIAGVQEKTAFLKIEGQWNTPVGATPTSHIFKPAMKSQAADFSDSPWNEWFCLNLCQELGLPVCGSEVEYFGNHPVLVVERFDRLWKQGKLYRLPQEDMCQALSVAPMGKYQSEGGPGILEIMQLLNGALNPQDDKRMFLRAQIVFWLLAAIDGHAKNFSIFLSPGGFRLTPLYDVMSIAPYPSLSWHKAKMAMSIGDKKYYRIKQIKKRHFYQTAQTADLSIAIVEEIIDDVLGRMDVALENAVSRSEQLKMPHKTRDPILKLIEAQAKKLAPDA